MDKIEKLKQLLILTQNDTVTPQVLEKFLVMVLDIIKKSKDNFENISAENLQTIASAIAHIEELKANVDNDLSVKSSALLGQIDAKLALINDTLEKVKKIKATPGKDGTDGNNGADGKDGKDGKDGSPDTGNQIIEKVNSSDKKIKSERIEGVEKLASQANLDRAISILDQRTQFLINKQTGSGSGTVQSVVAGTNITVDNTDPANPIVSATGGGGGTWGSITGTLSDQTDLQNALDAKVTANAGITGATKTKITYDSKGLVTAGADATTADIADSSNKRYVTDAQLTVIGNTSGTNTGDNATNTQYSGLATSKQDALSGTGFVKISGTTISYDNSTYLTTSTAASTYQPLDTQLTSIAGLSYTGNAGKFIRVNAGETDFELATIGGGGDALTSGGLTQFLGNNNWKVFYSDGSGDTQELALGAAGTVLQSNGASSAPSFATPSGTGDVVGPASAINNNVVFFDGTTGKLIKDSGLTLSGSNTGDQTITLTGAVTGSGTGSFATTLATPGSLSVSSSNSNVTAHTHAITSSSAPGASASLLATDSSGHIGSTGTRIVKGWFTDLTVTNAIAGSITGNAATVTTNANLTGDVTSTGNATTVVKINGTSLAGLATGILKNTTATGVPSIAVAGDFPTLNQNTTGSASSLSISGQTGLLTFTGLASTNRAKTVRDAADTILELGGSYTPTGTWTNMPLTTPAITGLATGSGVASAATASTLASRDANGNSSFVNSLEGYTTTATAAGTTTLTVSSNNMQYFTGSTTQTVVMPVTSTLVLGQSWWIVNLSTGAVTVNSSGGNAIVIVAAGTYAEITCILTSGTSAASWNAGYIGTVVTSGKKLSVSNSLTIAGTDGTTMTFPSTSATIARTDAANTFTGTQTITQIDVGNTDTSITRSAAGIIAVEGVAVPTISSADTLSNKTLTAPKFADLGYIADANGNELIILDTVTSAVNEITLANAATGANPNITPSGGDSNIGLDITPKGTGTVNIKGNATQAGTLRLYEDTDNGTNYTGFKVGTQSADIDYVLPTSQGAASTVLTNDGSGNLSWATAGGGGGWVLVDNTAFSGATSVTINDGGSNLAGNTDEMYMLVVRAKISSGDKLIFRFNTDRQLEGFLNSVDNADTNNIDGNTSDLFITANGSYTNHQFTAYISTKTAMSKIVTASGLSHNIGDNTGRMYQTAGFWEDTSTAVTQFILATAGGSATFSSGSEYWLYKAA